MKTKKPLRRTKALFDSDEREQLKQRTALVKLLKKLRKRRHQLKHELAETSDSQRSQQIKDELQVLKAQRKKAWNYSAHSMGKTAIQRLKWSSSDQI